ncbi:PREDICTED: growth hormone-regulated TBC protein 1 [Tarenaya hassleriana]|uniref:growth hormone-regulated TBC protein 1 n=1 Tax=Tarenaya hassleriana TaxID=28532 RepID=UPI00053C8D86|nr:PREDICTED: growth hormone-regulated TBC protein 1 [Tarenaya hassleriana]XP_010534268.1 PREDICTED: growth hormone-regulated TBC protein 1 [Tarenaya hassleriana]XP_010534269.1 PREDICTED: growth hormone-regulated TBC protein 1 [Tarenaya hassleriana]
MFGTQSKRDLALELQAQIPILRPSIHARRANLTVKFQDLYGFTVEGNVDDVNVLNEVREKVRNQGRVWWALEASKGANWYLQPEILSVSDGIALKSSLKISTLTNAITLKRLIRKGIPPVLRPKVWFSLSGAAKKKSTVPESYYSDLTKAVDGKVTAATRQIDHDLPRTFPGHPWLDTPEGHAALRRVLVGYSFRDSDVGYCQGLNYVAALLLLVMKTEEEAFWMLAVLLENVLVNDCYTNNLSGCHVEQRVFKDFLTKKCPRIATHLEDIGFDVSLVATEWFLCLFSKSLPSETTLRVWDVLFYEGAKVLIHVALAMFKMKEDALLLTHQVGDVINILQKTTHHLFDPDELLTVAFDKIGSMTTNTISKQRKKQEPAVMAELDQRLRRLNSLKEGEK